MSQNKFYRIEAKAGSADVYIYGEIGESWFEESVTARQFVSDIKDLEKKHDTINVRINSPGGSVFDGLAIFNALANSTAQIHTWNDGLAASMAALVLMSGNTVHAAKNSLTMLHSPSTYVSGNSKKLREAIDVLEKVQNSLIECLMPRTKKTRTEIENSYFDYSDHWLSAEEAKNEGFVDDITEKESPVNQKDAAKDVLQMVAHLNENEKKDSGFMRFVNKVVAAFTPTAADPVPTPDPNFHNDMDMKPMKDALSLSDTATDDDVLNAVKKAVSDLAAERAALAAEKAARKTAEDNLTAEKALTASQAQKIADLEKEPGADPAKVDPDPPKGEDTEPENFFQALASVRKILKK